MARSLTEIKQQITSKFIENSDVQTAYGLDANKTFEQQFSTVLPESILFYVVAFAAWFVETLFDTHKAEVLDIIARMKPHTAAWYQTKAKSFLLGFDLIPGEDVFDVSGKTPDEIEQAQTVRYAAVSELPNKIRIKVAKTDAGNNLTPLSDAELTAFEYYISQIKDAGTAIELQNTPADSLKINIIIYYNLLILRSDGTDFNGTPVVVNAIKNYIANIEFDGTFVTTKLVDALQAVDGIKYVHVSSIATKYGGLNYITLNDGRYRPDSGYIVFDETGSNLTFQPA